MFKPPSLPPVPPTPTPTTTASAANTTSRVRRDFNLPGVASRQPNTIPDRKRQQSGGGS